MKEWIERSTDYGWFTLGGCCRSSNSLATRLCRFTRFELPYSYSDNCGRYCAAVQPLSGCPWKAYTVNGQPSKAGTGAVPGAGAIVKSQLQERLLCYF